MRRFSDLLKRFHKDERGVFAVFFALLAVVLIATSGAVVDFTQVETMRSRAQTSLDSAALALQPTIGQTGVTSTTIKAKAQSMLTQQLNNSSVTATVTDAAIDMVAGKLTLSAHISVPTAFVQLVGVTTLQANLTAEVTRGSKDLEVSVSLDTTGSMLGTKITALIDATNDLIDDVVQTAQTPTYSKMAIIPWSASVNVGSSYVANIRGTPTPPASITSATWMAGTSKTISGVTKANPAVVTTSTAHGFVAGDYVYISNVNGMTNLNNNIYKVGNASPAGSTTKFQLKNVDNSNVNSSAWPTFTTSASSKITKCFNSTCELLVTTSTAHGHVAGDVIYISGATGTLATAVTTPTTFNGLHTLAAGSVASTTTYYLNEYDPDNVLYNTYGGSGKSYCTKYGCPYYYWTNMWGSYLYQPNNCVSERSTNAYTDTAPSTTRLGFNYTSGGADCVSKTMQPLTTNKTTLHALVNSLTASDKTAGHLGLAWGWYMVAPNFGYLWPSASQPAAYNNANLVKAVILMTDGVFNVEYCNGVRTDDISCASPNGNSHDQALALCDAVKTPANGVVLYTVGFDLGGDTASLNFLRDCATDPSHFFQADTGADLANAFTAIAQNLNELRISK